MSLHTWFAVVLVIVVVAGRPGRALAQEYDVRLVVDARSPVASDANDGTAARPLRTIGEAMKRAGANKKRYVSTAVSIAPGVYREAVSFGFTNYPGNQPGNRTPVLVEGAGSGATVISGADVFAGWAPAGDGTYAHPWPHDWGLAPDPTGGRIADPSIVLRREMVFVDGERMRQVLSASEMAPGTYRVDEAGDRLYLRPPSGVDPASALVEVAMRERGWDTSFEHALTLRGFSVRHVATPWKHGLAALRLIACDDAVIEDVVIEQNNFLGLYVQLGAGAVVRRVRANHNGHSGWGLHEVRDILLEDTETSYNNWRGHLGGFVSWDPGNKSYGVHGMTLRRHRSVGNLSRGLWFDTDHRDVVIEGVELRNNLRDGLFVEAVQGPVELRGGRIADNGEFGVRSGTAERVTLDGVEIEGNAWGGILVSGEEAGLSVEDFETGASVHVRSRQWTIRGCAIDAATAGSGRFLIGTTFGRESWSEFVATLRSDGNRWWDPAGSGGFEWHADERIGLEEWRRRTGQDAGSSYTSVAGHVAAPLTETDAERAPGGMRTEVSPAYPNPFDQRAAFSVAVARAQHVRAGLYDLMGRLVLPIYEGVLSPGTSHELTIEAGALAAGSYFYRVEGEDFRETRPVVHVR